jgi:murein DD-endopeptidase MepM/ murein hydrolase activator NlpD
MASPRLEIDILPSRDGKVYYLPLAPRSLDHEPRLKIGVRLRITHADPDHGVLTITGISFSFPGTDLETRPMVREQQYMDPEGGVLTRGQTATWCNGSVWTEDEERAYNQVYLDSPAPPRLKVEVHCEETDRPYSETWDLIPWTDPTGEGPVRIPFALHDLADDEYVVTSARHWYNGGSNGTQIFAHDITIQARIDGEWTGTYSGTAAANEDVRIFGRPVRAMADGEVIAVEDKYADNPYNEELTGRRYGSNSVWVRYRDLEVKYSHLRSGSILVAVGDRVRAGRKLAEAGNSGNTGGDPHLHLECRVANGNTLCGFTFRNAWMIDRSLVPASGRGRRVRLDGQGICEEKAAIRPFATARVPIVAARPDPEFEAIAAEVFGGVSQGGDGFVIVGGRIVKVPPRGIRGELMRAIVDLDEADELAPVDASRRRRDAAEAIEKALRNLRSR